ncbi:hypothetical protein DFQ26_004276 [Actinomortierella ambigua]|nr:hypothetical protein DFQ26_004276 [Actinomortierella ambigua]
MLIFKALTTVCAVLATTVLAHNGSTGTPPGPDPNAECLACAFQAVKAIPSCASLPSFPPVGPGTGTLGDLRCLCDILSHTSLFAPCQPSCGSMAELIANMHQQYDETCASHTSPPSGGGSGDGSGGGSGGGPGGGSGSGSGSGSAPPRGHPSFTSGSGSGGTGPTGSSEPSPTTGNPGIGVPPATSSLAVTTTAFAVTVTTEIGVTVTVPPATNTPTPSTPLRGGGRVNTPNGVMLATAALLLTGIFCL